MGTFTQQLSEPPPTEIKVVGVEPSSAMRERTIQYPQSRCVVSRSRVENAPFSDGGADAVIAAAVAHWFNCPFFYEECCRVLTGAGLLALVEYFRDKSAPAARAVIGFWTVKPSLWSTHRRTRKMNCAVSHIFIKPSIYKKRQPCICRWASMPACRFHLRMLAKQSRTSGSAELGIGSARRVRP